MAPCSTLLACAKASTSLVVQAQIATCCRSSVGSDSRLVCDSSMSNISSKARNGLGLVVVRAKHVDELARSAASTVTIGPRPNCCGRQKAHPDVRPPSSLTYGLRCLQHHLLRCPLVKVPRAFLPCSRSQDQTQAEERASKYAFNASQRSKRTKTYDGRRRI